MYDVLLFTDVNNTLGFGRYAGAYRIATELRSAGYKTQVIDFFAAWSESELDLIISKYVTKETLLVGFSTTLFIPKIDNYSNQIEARKYVGAFPYNNETMTSIFSLIKSKNPNSKIVIGGAKATFEEIEGVDYYIWGEGEISIVQLAKHLKFNAPISVTFSNRITSVEYPYKDFNTSTIIWEDNDFIFSDEHLPIELSRGCRFKCSFCSYNLNGKKPSDYIKSSTILEQEFKNNYDLLGTTGYMFCDDTYNDSLEKVKSMHSLLTKLPFNIEWTSYARIDMIYRYPEMIELLQESGIKSIYFGIETFNPITAKKIGKGLDPNKVKDTLYKCKEIWKDDVIMTGSFIVGLPEESKQSILDTIKWLSKEDCPMDNSLLIPLNLKKRKKSQFTISDISMNFENYGYEVYDDLNWKNDYMTKKEAIKMVEQFHYDRKQKLSGFTFYSRFRNLGYSSTECMKLEESTETYKELDLKYEKLKQEYFQKLIF